MLLFAPSLLLAFFAASTTPAFGFSVHRGTLLGTSSPSIGSKTLLRSAVAPPPEDTAEKTEREEAIPGVTAWECNDDATECVQVPACDESECRTSLDVRIHNTWYDLSGWRKAHPAGVHWIDWYDGRDATEVMDGFHSAKGREMYKRLPKSNTETSRLLEATTEPDSPTQIAFRKLRDDLEAQGWWERDMAHEYTQLGLWASCVVGAMLTVQPAPFISTCLLSISMTAAGWLGHDYVHGVDAFADKFRNFAAVAAGLHPTWWSDKVRSVLYA